MILNFSLNNTFSRFLNILSFFRSSPAGGLHAFHLHFLNKKTWPMQYYRAYSLNAICSAVLWRYLHLFLALHNFFPAKLNFGKTNWKIFYLQGTLAAKFIMIWIGVLKGQWKVGWSRILWSAVQSIACSLLLVIRGANWS